MNMIQQIQQLLGVNPDGQFGPLSYQALQNAIDNNSPVIIQIQGLLGVKQDGDWGNLSFGALHALLNPSISQAPDISNVVVPAGWIKCITSEFATDADLAAYNKAIEEGKTQQEAFAVGDNCVGCWLDNTHGPTPMLALPPETIAATWGTPWNVTGKHQEVIVTNPANNESVVAILDDVMPHLAHIRNGAGMDSNVPLCQALGLPYGAMVPVLWKPAPITPTPPSV